MGFFIESADRPYKSAVAGEDLLVGLLVEAEGDGTVTAVDDTSTRIDGVVASPRAEAYIAEEMDDATDFEYKANVTDGYALAGAHLVPFGGYEDGARVKVRTILDPEDVDADAVALDHDTIVGVAQVADTDYNGRVVQEGYSDGTTTYSRANSNFLALGAVLRDSSTSFDDIVRVEVRKDL